MNSLQRTLMLSLLLIATSAAAEHIAEAPQQTIVTPGICPAPAANPALKGIVGEVRLQYHVGVEGLISDIKLLKSSGVRALDRSAVVALSQCTLPTVGADPAEAQQARVISYAFSHEGHAERPEPARIATSVEQAD